MYFVAETCFHGKMGMGADEAFAKDKELIVETKRIQRTRAYPHIFIYYQSIRIHKLKVHCFIINL